MCLSVRPSVCLSVSMVVWFCTEFTLYNSSGIQGKWSLSNSLLQGRFKGLQRILRTSVFATVTMTRILCWRFFALSVPECRASGEGGSLAHTGNIACYNPSEEIHGCIRSIEGSGELSYNNAFGYMGVFNLEYNLPSWYQNFPGKTGRFRVPSMVGDIFTASPGMVNPQSLPWLFQKHWKMVNHDLPDLEYHDLQCGAPQICLLVYKPH